MSLQVSLLASAVVELRLLADSAQGAAAAAWRRATAQTGGGLGVAPGKEPRGGKVLADIRTLQDLSVRLYPPRVNEFGEDDDDEDDALGAKGGGGEDGLEGTREKKETHAKEDAGGEDGCGSAATAEEAQEAARFWDLCVTLLEVPQKSPTMRKRALRCAKGPYYGANEPG